MSEIPSRIGKYEVVRRLGYGGMGAVYLARDPDLDRLLAIKVLREIMLEEEVIQRFLREARAAGNLRHDNVITVYDAGQHDHQPFMAMEYVDGVSLAELIRTRQPLPLADKLSYLEQICAGLHYAHGQGIVHRDIKPANLMVDRRNVVRILDFGIARVEGSGMTRDGALIGTLNYMSPEQMLGRPVDHRSDIFAFGAVAYELLAYEKAFPGSVQDGLLQRLPNEPPHPLGDRCPGLPEALEAVVMRALAKQPQDRFADLAEARAALRQIRRHLDPDQDLEPIPAPRRGGSSATPSPVPASEQADSADSVHRCLTEAEHRLSHGEIESADGFVRQALRLEPGNAAALAMRARIERSASSHGIALPTVVLPKTKDPTPAGGVVPAGPQHSDRGAAPIASGAAAAPAAAPPAVRKRLDVPARRLALAGAVAAAAVVGGWLWMSSLDDPAAPAEPLPAARVDEPPAAPPEAVAAPPEAVAAPPPAAPASAPSPLVDAERLLTEQLTRIEAAYKTGDLEGALLEMRPVLARTSDERARTLARTIASDARRAMNTAAAAARKQKAAGLSPGVFAAAERARDLSEDAFGRNDFIEAGVQALRASTNYTFAEREAAAAAAKTAAAPPPRTAEAERPSPPAATPAPAPPVTPASTAANPPPAPTPTPLPPVVVAAPPPAATPAAAAAAARASAIEVERAGVLRALNRYQDAYRNRSIKDLQTVYPSLPREERQALERSFGRVCRAVDLTYFNPQFGLNADDPTAATVTARTTFTCQSGTGQDPAVVSGQQVFLLRKAGDTWLIDRIITDPATR